MNAPQPPTGSGPNEPYGGSDRGVGRPQQHGPVGPRRSPGKQGQQRSQAQRGQQSQQWSQPPPPSAMQPPQAAPTAYSGTDLEQFWQPRSKSARLRSTILSAVVTVIGIALVVVLVVIRGESRQQQHHESPSSEGASHQASAQFVDLAAITVVE